MRRVLWLLFLCWCWPVAIRAQEEGGPEAEEDDPEILVDGGAETGAIDIAIDPFEELPDLEEPNRPAPIQVGIWRPRELEAGARRELESLRARRSEQPGDASIRYRLAEFYLSHRWFPQAEAEFFACGQLDPDSIRPWEGLLRVYAERPRTQREVVQLVRRAGVVRLVPETRPETDWLASPAERDRRITHAWSEIVKRRPDDVSRRRSFIAHLERVHDYARLEQEARAILERLPDDADTRFTLAEAVRHQGSIKEREEAGSGREEFDEACRLLEENLRLDPDHAPSALRLARMIALRDGAQAEDRISALEGRAFFRLFVKPELASVPFRPDTLRMARDLAGPRIANRLWDESLGPPPREEGLSRQTRPYYRRWIYLHFPNAPPRERERVLGRLARRGDREAAGILISFLWHQDDYEDYARERLADREIAKRIEDAAVEAAVRLGPACFPAARKLLGLAKERRHRRRAVSVLRGMGDRRAVRPLLDALAWEKNERYSYGIAATLEELGDRQAIDALVEAALDRRRPVARRKEAAEALAAFRDLRTIEALNRLYAEQGFDIVAAYGLLRLTGAEKAQRHLAGLLASGSETGEVVRLLAKCDHPAVERLVLAALDTVSPSVVPTLVGLLKKRYWATSKERVKAFLLRAAGEPGVSDFTIGMLGEFGGAAAADRLLQLVETLQGKRWAKAARALARTGDPRGVRYFSRARIIAKDPGKRRLATDLYEEAVARRAERERAGRGDRAPASRG